MKSFYNLFNSISAILLLIILLPVFIMVSVLIYSTSKGPILHWSKRVGKYNKLFMMPKFRTMYLDTPDIATHLLKNPDKMITKIGSLLRKLSLDELPQLYSIIINDMVFIGPRPALHNQFNLVELRTHNNIHKQKPGLTGWAQINGRDSISIKEKVKLEKYYLDNKSVFLNIYILFFTIIRITKKNSISH